MAPSFGRSISLTLSPAASHKAARHVRSASLPCSSHPLLAHLHSQIGAIRSWIQNPASVPAGLTHLDALHAALSEFLLLPEARSALKNGSATASCTLDGFLVLADAHGAFQATALELKAHSSEAQGALRRRDAARLASAARSQRKAEKELARLSESVGMAARRPAPSSASSAAEIEVAGVLVEAVSAIATASSAVFAAVESMSAAATTLAASSSKKTSLIMSFVKRSSKPFDEEKEILALERLEEVEAFIAEIESGSDKVFRSILHTRVALLNIQTQSCC